MSKEVYYGLDGQERLDSEIEETLERFVDELSNDCKVQYPIKVYEWEREKMYTEKNPEKFSKQTLEEILEQLDDTYGDPDDFGTDPSEKLQQAMMEFTKVLIEEYDVLCCNKTGKVFEYSKEELLKGDSDE